MNRSRQPKNQAKNSGPLKQQKRNILSYRSNPNDPGKQRRRAKTQMKKGEKADLVFTTPTLKLTNVTTQTLPNGTSVDIFKPKEQNTRRFGLAHPFKHPRSHLKVETASDLIHQISTQVAQSKPVVVAETSIKDINNEYISNMNGFTAEDYRKNHATNHIIRVSPPQFMKSPMFRRNPYASSANQQKRWDALSTQRFADIEAKKKNFAAYVEQLAGFQPFDALFKSTSEAPIDFSQDVGLKFRIIDAVIKHTKIQVPSSALATINNVTQLVDFVVAKRNELEANSQIRKNQERLPANVTYVYTDKIDRTKKPKWEKYVAARQNQAVATADV